MPQCTKADTHTDPEQLRESCVPADDAHQIGITVLLPCRNEAETIAACLVTAGRVINESLLEGEILVAGNGSTDGLGRFPTDHDCLMYHLPVVNEWLQARSLFNPES